MTNFFTFIITTFIQAAIIIGIIKYFNYKLNTKDNEIAERDKLLGEKTLELRKKNLKIKEMQNERKR